VEVKYISKNTKMRLYTSIDIPTAIYANETWRTTDKTNRMLNVFNRCLRDIMGVSWKDHVTNEELLSSAGIGDLQDIVADRRRRFVGHDVKTSQSGDRLDSEGGSRRWGRPKRTCRIHVEKICKKWVSLAVTLMKPGALPVIVLNGDNSSPSSVLVGTGGPKSKLSKYVRKDLG